MSSTAVGRASSAPSTLTHRSLKARALKVAEEMCILRWASITDLYRQEVLLEEEICRREWADVGRDRSTAQAVTFARGYRI